MELSELEKKVKAFPRDFGPPLKGKIVEYITPEGTFQGEEYGYNFVICFECGKRLKAITNSHLGRHNMTLYDYRVKYPYEDVVCIESREKNSNTQRMKSGLIHEVLEKRYYCSRCDKGFSTERGKSIHEFWCGREEKREVWNKGKKGVQVPWNKTPEDEMIEIVCLNCENIFKVIPSREFTAKYCSHLCKQRHQGTYSKLPEVKEKIRRKVKETFLTFGDVILPESKEHFKLKMTMKEMLLGKGYKVYIEHPVIIGENLYIIDVVGEGQNNIAVECGNCSVDKLRNLGVKFDIVIHVPFDKEAYVVR